MASEIRVDKINSLSGVGTVTLSPTGVDIAGITTVATLRATTGIVTSLTAGSLTSLGAVSGTTGTFTGNVAVSGANITLQDSGGSSDDRLVFGAGSDLSIYHDGSNSYLQDSGTGDLLISGDSVSIVNAAASEFKAKFISDGAVELYHNNSKKLDTDSEGISVTGTVKINNTSSVGDYNGGADDMLIGTHSGNHGMTILSGTSNGGYIMFSDNNGGGTNAYRGQIEYAHSSDYMRFMTNSAEALRIDSNKMLGLGVTPKTQNTFNAIELGLAGFLGSQTGAKTIEMASNAYYNSGWKYRAADVASQYYQYQGYHAFTSASSGSADGAISFSEKLRILSGGGITFNGDTATANALDDYEEGTFAPQYSGDSGAGNYGYARQAGKYTKIGNTVYYSFYITTNVVNANASGNLIITGLPFTSGSNNEYYQGASIGYYASWNNTYPSHALCDVNNTRLYIYKTHANTNIQHAVPTDVTNGTSLIVSGHYHVA